MVRNDPDMERTHLLRDQMRKAIYAAIFVSLTLIVVASGGFQRLVMDPAGHARLSPAEETAASYEARDWSIAEFVNTPAAYKDFLTLHPAGQHAPEAMENRKRLDSSGHFSEPAAVSQKRSGRNGESALADTGAVPLTDVETIDWTEARQANTVAAYRLFLDRHPQGLHAADAGKRLDIFTRIQREWESTLHENTTEGYREFAAKYTGFTTSRDVVGALTGYEESYWKTVTHGNSPDLYDTYVKLFPRGEHAEEAESRLITMEVNKIFQERHEKIPSLNKTESPDMVCPDRSKIVLRNTTPYTLTILYSGPESRKFTLYPDETTTFGIKNGKYRIAAEGRSGQVYQLAGEQSLDGGEYQSTYTPRR